VLVRRMKEASLMCGVRGCREVAEYVVEAVAEGELHAYCEEHAKGAVSAAGRAWTVTERKPAQATGLVAAGRATA